LRLSDDPEMQKQHVQLSDADRLALESLLVKGQLQARAFKRATALLELDRGKTLQAVASTLSVDYNTVAIWRDKYKEQGLACLQEAARSGRPIVIDGTQRAQITALACSDAPAGRARWSLRLLADKIVELGDGETISHTQVGNILKKTKSSRT
jgi:putative transposase